MKLRTATIEDFIMPKFRGKDPKDYEIRHNGECVRKDRWELGIQRIRELCGIKGNSDWEIKDVISKVEDMRNREYPHYNPENSRDMIKKSIAMEQAMQNFIDRVEKGEIRSTKTYSEFKDILSRDY